MLTWLFVSLIGFAILVVAWQLLTAPLRASKSPAGIVSIVGGLVLYVTWTPHEALVITRSGRHRPILGLDRLGGWTIMYPMLGDRLDYRCDLRIYSFSWQGDVLTRESIPCHVKVDVWWSVTDVTAFMAAAGTVKRLDEEKPQVSVLETMEMRLKTLTDSFVRSIIGGASLLEFLTSVKTSYTDAAQIPAADAVASISKSLATNLSTSLGGQTGRYGILVDRVEVPGVRFAPEIEKELMSTWLSHLKPIRAKQESDAVRIDDQRKLDVLEREKDLLGVSTIGTREIIKHMPDTPGIAMESPAVSVLKISKHIQDSREASEAKAKLPPPADQPPA